MKKYFSALCIAAVGLAMAACTPKEEIKPGGETVAPELGEIQGCVLDNAGPDIVVEYKAADFGTSAVINYALFVDQAGKDMASKQQVKVKAEAGKLTIPQINLNNSILALGAAVNTEVAVEFQLVAYLGSTIGTASLESNIVSAKFTTCLAQTIDYDTYDYVYTIGAFNNWAWEAAPGDGVQQYLYDYNGTGVYEGLIYFAGAAHSGWKIAGITGAWDDSCNWGFNDSGDDQYLVGTDPINEFTLQCSGGSKDMKAWSRNFAYFTFDKNTLALKLKTITSWDDAEYGVQFDHVMLTGTFCNWKETIEEGAVMMNYDPSLHRFYADITVEDNAEIKMYAPNANYDNKWHLQWGDNGGNVKIESAGNYRVYLDINHETVTVTADKYGATEEHGVLAEDIPEPVVLAPEPSLWTVVGNFNNWPNGEEGDTYVMTELAHHEWVYYGLELKAGDELKVRGDHSWDSESYGAAEGGNVVIAEDGTYDIYFKYEDRYVNALLCGGGYSVIGVVEGYKWSKDFEMTETETGVFVSDPIKIEGAFKLRYRHAWTDAIGAAETNDVDGQDSVYKLTVGEAAAAATGGVYNFFVPEAGTYKVTYDSNANTVTLDTAFPAAVYMNGSLNSWEWNDCVELVPVNGVAGQFWTVRYLAANTEFKFNTAKSWNGGETPSVGEAVGFTTPGNALVENAGLYIILVDYVNNKTTVAPAAINGIGDCFGSWDVATPFTVNADGTASITTTKEGQLRMYAAAPEGYTIDWWRMEFIFFEDGVIAYRGNGGDQDRYTVAAGKTVTLDFNAGTGSVN